MPEHEGIAQSVVYALHVFGEYFVRAEWAESPAVMRDVFTAIAAMRSAPMLHYRVPDNGCGLFIEVGGCTERLEGSVHA